MLLLLDGPDGAGKTTLAQKLANRRPRKPAFVQHHGPYKGASGAVLAKAILDSLAPRSEPRHIVDRCWLSELAYGPVYRGGSRIDGITARMLERVALQQGAVVVRCLPPFEVCKKAFTSGRDEMLDSVAQLRQVYDAYAKQTTTLPVIEYDYTQDDWTLIPKQAEHLSRARRPKAVILGEAANLKGHPQAAWHLQTPFISFKDGGCSRWLTARLELAGIPEDALEWHNVNDRGLCKQVLPHGVPVFALGAEAAKWCMQHDVSCQVFDHPQYHKRFKNEAPYPLIEALFSCIGDPNAKDSAAQ